MEMLNLTKTFERILLQQATFSSVRFYSPVDVLLPLSMSPSVSGERWCTSQLNVVLLGGRNSGKSSVGNLILGKEEFVTRERTSCSRRVALVAGRCLTVVDTPGWWCDFSAQDTCELVKREIVTSVSLCSPGPHVFLIAVKVSSAFSEKRRRALEEHVALLGEGVWGHCVVVYTSNHKGPKHRGADRKTLGWLDERCGRRCHTVVLGEGSGGTELLEKIQQLVAGNGFRVFEVEERVLQEAVEEKRQAEERAQQRFLRVKRHRTLVRGEFIIFFYLLLIWVLKSAKSCFGKH